MVWFAIGVLLLAACSGGDEDASLDLAIVAPDATTAPEIDPVDSSGGIDDPAASETNSAGDGGDPGATADLGPALEPITSFVASSSFAPAGYGIAVSPIGDRVAVMWVAETDSQTNLAIYDAATGNELAASTDERLDGDVLWTSDNRIVTFGTFATLREWDSGTLAFISEIPLAGDELECSGGNGSAYDAGAGALFLKSDSLCRIDVGTGETIQFGSENRTTLLAVAIGGDEVYLRGTDDAGELVLLVLDATTLDIVSDEPTDGPNPVIAASGNGTIAQESGGFGYVVQPSGRVVDFSTAGIQTSGGGGYYVAGFAGGTVVISSADGRTVGTISNGAAVLKTAWSADDTVMAAFTDEGVSVYRLG